ncbi:protein of unknown function [Streptomyces sp. KY75]|nr:protein of unknown function [Streptomyces sp. KY75]
MPADRHRALLMTLRPGQVVTRTVTRIADFGVTFVDIGGFEAMINIPELSWRRFDHPSDVVSVGERVEAEILGVEHLPERVALSLKPLHDDPMRLLTGQTGRTVVGPVTKVLPFGVFVRVEEAENGFEGLVHISELADEHVDGADIAVQVGDFLPVKILDVDPTRRSSPRTACPSCWRATTPASRATGATSCTAGSPIPPSARRARRRRGSTRHGSWWRTCGRPSDAGPAITRSPASSAGCGPRTPTSTGSGPSTRSRSGVPTARPC